ncbi:MAG: type II toxin-antitoxin system RelE family toxin [Thermoanaerobaculum sp.]
MARYKLLFRASVVKDLRPLPPRVVERVLAAAEKLQEDPTAPPACKLSGEPRYRLRVGAYRLIYEVREAQGEVVVVKVGHRREVYRR